MCQWRKHLVDQGFDAGAAITRYHLALSLDEMPTMRTVHRVLVHHRRRGCDKTESTARVLSRCAITDGCTTSRTVACTRASDCSCSSPTVRVLRVPRGCLPDRDSRTSRTRVTTLCRPSRECTSVVD